MDQIRYAALDAIYSLLIFKEMKKKIGLENEEINEIIDKIYKETSKKEKKNEEEKLAAKGHCSICGSWDTLHKRDLVPAKYSKYYPSKNRIF